MKLSCFTILSLAICLRCFSQQAYSLDDCFAAAKKNNTSFQKNDNDIKSNYINKKAATFSLFPAIYANAEHVFSSGKNIDPVTNNFIRDNFSGGYFDVTVELNIFSGFNALNAIKSSLYKIKAGEYAYQKNELEIYSAITVAYAKLMLSKEQVATIKNNNLHTQNELNVVQEKINVGKLSKSDYYTINMRYKTEQAALFEMQNDSISAINDLKYLVGLKYNLPFDVQDVDSNDIISIAVKDFNLSAVLEKVLKDNPALLESMFIEKSAEMNVKSAKGNLLPSISVSGNIFSNYNLNEQNLNGSKVALGKQIDNNFGKTAGISLQVPLFNQYQNKLAIEREKINLSTAKLATQQIENEVVKNTQQLLNDFLAAKQKFVLENEALQQAQLSYESFEERYKLGYISSLELILAKDQLYAQQSNASKAKYDLYFKYKLIELLLR